jgi:hypothetical protein
MYHVALRGEVHTSFRWVNLKDRDHLKDLSGDGRIILKWIFRIEMGAWTGLVCLTIGISAGLL